MDFPERLLQFSHEFDLRVQPTNSSHSSLKIVLHSIAAAPLRHNQTKLVLPSLHPKCCHYALLSLLVLQKFLVELNEVNFVAQLLEHVVKHHLFQLVKCRYVQKRNEPPSEPVICPHFLVQYNQISAVRALSQFKNK